MKKIHYIAQSYVKTMDASVKPRTDVEDILKKNGAINIGINRLFCKNQKLVLLLNHISYLLSIIRMPKNKIVFLQYPHQYHLLQIFNKAKKKHNKIILFVHDIDELRGFKTSKNSNILNFADVIIVHTEAMKKWMISKYPTSKCIVLDSFDYLLEQNLSDSNIEKKTMEHFSIVFAGNLLKSKFIYNIPQNDNIEFHLYGLGIEEEKLNNNVMYEGATDPNNLINTIKTYDFGLVWDGIDANSCTGEYGNYLRYNYPYKTSSYLSAGLPLIVWNEMGIKDYVETNKIGLAINSISELQQKLNKLTISEYNEMKKNVNEIRNKIRSGFYTKTAIQKSIEFLGSNEH